MSNNPEFQNEVAIYFLNRPHTTVRGALAYAKNGMRLRWL